MSKFDSKSLIYRDLCGKVIKPWLLNVNNETLEKSF